MNQVPVARLGLILGEDGATASRKLFRYLWGPKTLSTNKKYISNSRSTASAAVMLIVIRQFAVRGGTGSLEALEASREAATQGARRICQTYTPGIYARHICQAYMPGMRARHIPWDIPWERTGLKWLGMVLKWFEMVRDGLNFV